MPLTANTTYSLQGHSRPGDAVQSKPKHAMILRLSSDILDSLENFATLPAIDFDFGNSPGIHLGNKFVPLLHQKEDSSHELYLRTSSAAKPNGPLKLYARVTGKLTLADRELNRELADKIGQSSKKAAEERQDRRTKLLDTPPDLSATSAPKKRKDASSLFRKPQRQSEHVSRSISSSVAPPTRVSSPSTHPQTTEGVVPLSRRIAHFIANAMADNQAHTTEDVVKAVGGSRCDAKLRQEILDTLNELAEQDPDRRQKPSETPRLRLKPKGWLEVRPYEWPKLSEAHRTALARSARMACNNLRIPESDPIWQHFKFRSSGNTPASSIGRDTSASEAQQPHPNKRGISSREMKEKKSKSKKDTPKEIQVKDESKLPVTGKSSLGERKAVAEVDRGTDAHPVSSRNPPGSGYRLPRSPTNPSADHAAPKRANAASVSSRTVGDGKGQTPKKSGIGDDSDFTRDHRNKDKDPSRNRSSMAADAKDVTNKGKEYSALSVKRKSAVDGDVEDRKSNLSQGSAPIHKKRKIDVTTTETAPDKKVSATNNPSRPSTLSQNKLAGTQDSSSKNTAAAKSSGGTRRSRRSPIYTSSEDEGTTAPAKSNSTSLLTPPAATPSSVNSSSSSKTAMNDRAALRARYNSTYIEYITAFQKVSAQRGRIQRSLENYENDSAGSFTDTDGDVEMMDADALAKLSADHRRLRNELEQIREVYGGSEL